MKRSTKPWLQDEEKQILRETSGYVDPDDVRADMDESNVERMSYGLPVDPYQRVQAESLNAVPHYGNGYLRTPKGGYINVPTPPSGGFLPILGSLAAMILPELIGGIAGKIFGNGRQMTGNHRMIYTRNPLNMSNGNAFYKSLYNDLSSQTTPEIVDKKFNKLFGSGWKKYKKMKVGGSIDGPLKMGHIMIPPLMCHLRNALKGSGVDPEKVLESVEKMEILNQPITAAGLQHGGNIFGSIWNGIKGIFGKLIGNKTLQNVGSKVAESVGKSAAEHLPNLAEKGVDALSKYASRKLTGEEPEISEEEMDKQKDRRISKLKRDAEIRKLERQLEREEEENEEEEEERYTPRRRKSSRYEDEELPSGRSDSSLRKRLANERRARDTEKRIIPRKSSRYDDEDEDEDEDELGQLYMKNGRLIRGKIEPGMHVLKYETNGEPVYGFGKKKKGGHGLFVSCRGGDYRL